MLSHTHVCTYKHACVYTHDLQHTQAHLCTLESVHISMSSAFKTYSNTIWENHNPGRVKPSSRKKLILPVRFLLTPLPSGRSRSKETGETELGMQHDEESVTCSLVPTLPPQPSAELAKHRKEEQERRINPQVTNDSVGITADGSAAWY